MEITYQFVAFTVLIVVGIVMVSHIAQDNGLNNLNNYTLNFTQNPPNGTHMIIDNHDFQFLNDTSQADNNTIPIQIHNNVAETTNELRYALQQNTSMKVD
jgi:hypothetical protein